MQSGNSLVSSKPHYEQLGFEHKKVVDKNGKLKYFAVCRRCSTELTNTSIIRMEQHRDSCNGVKKVNQGKKYKSEAIIYLGQGHRLGRHLSKVYDEMGFKAGKIKADNGMYRNIAVCLLCNRTIRNTSEHRLAAHRNVCNSKEYPPQEKTILTNAVPKFKEEIDLDDKQENNKFTTDIPIKNIGSPEQESTNKTEAFQLPVRHSYSFKKLLNQLEFKPARYKDKSGMVKSVAICLVCKEFIKSTAKSNLLAHRKTCKQNVGSPCKLGRKLGKLYEQLGYQSLKFKSVSGLLKNSALCLVCNKEIQNTSASRLMSHRRVCKSEVYSISPPTDTAAEDQQFEDDVSATNPNETESTDETTEIIQVVQNSSNLYDQLGFRSSKLENRRGAFKNVAFCLVCNTYLWNVASSRLIAHRRVCTSEKYNCLPTEEILIETVDYHIKDESCEAVEYDETDNKLITSNGETFMFKLEDSTRSNLKRKRDEFPIIDLHSTGDSSSLPEINEAVANFIYGCNLPLSVIESPHFKKVIEILDSTCLIDLPSKHDLSNDVLTTTYEKCLLEAKASWYRKEAALILNTVETKDKCKYYVSVLQDAIDGNMAFVGCLEIQDNLDEDDNFIKIVRESVEIAKDLYDTDVYVIVTDKMIRNDNPENFGNVWYVTCHRYLASLLLQDLLATINFKTCLFRVKLIVNELKRVNFNGTLKSRITELGPEVDNLYYLVENWEALQESALVENNFSDDLLLFFQNDSEFKNVCLKCVNKIDFINRFIKKLSLKTCSLADAVVLWQNFLIDPMVQGSSGMFGVLAQDRIQETRNVYSIVAHYFGEGRDTNFSWKDRKIIADFFQRVLSKEGFEEYIRFENVEVSSVLDRDDYYESKDFWEMMKKDLPIFAEFALQMLRIPGSSGGLQDVFKDFSKNNDDLNKDQLRKLMFMYFSAKVNEN